MSISALISSLRDEEGQGLAEYALILALIAIVAIVALIFLGGQVSSILSTVGALGLTDRSTTPSTTAGLRTGGLSGFAGRAPDEYVCRVDSIRGRHVRCAAASPVGELRGKEVPTT